ncbi:MAG TPA: diaminopimelate epimerase, partial [Polyangiaceae bacterium]|nr:diaminopimelate epimerase [Polyangiaceae bacterium]
MELRFDKYEGIGNDFLVVEAADPATLGSEQAVRLCDRHFGVGGDGVLLVVPSSVAGARARMIVLNADGSRPEMCGNGLRCVALHLVRAAGETQAEFDVETDAGLRHCSVRLDGPSGWITTGLGQAVPGGPWSADWSQQRVDFHRVSMGNPHTITFREPVTSEQLDDLGPLVSSCFP